MGRALFALTRCRFRAIPHRPLYGHPGPDERRRFAAGSRRVALKEAQVRGLSDGSCHEVYKRYFDPEALADELGGVRTLFSGTWFGAVGAHATR